MPCLGSLHCTVWFYIMLLVGFMLLILTDGVKYEQLYCTCHITVSLPISYCNSPALLSMRCTTGTRACCPVSGHAHAATWRFSASCHMLWYCTNCSTQGWETQHSGQGRVMCVEHGRMQAALYFSSTGQDAAGYRVLSLLPVAFVASCLLVVLRCLCANRVG